MVVKATAELGYRGGAGVVSCLVLPGVCPTDVGQPGLPGPGGLQQVQAGVDLGPYPLGRDLGVLRGHRGQVEGTAGWVCLPGPERQTTRSLSGPGSGAFPGPDAGLGAVTVAADTPAEVWIPGPGPGPGAGSGRLPCPWTGSGPRRPGAGSCPTAPAASGGDAAAPPRWRPRPLSRATSTEDSRPPPAGGDHRHRLGVKPLKTSSPHPTAIPRHLLEGQVYVPRSRSRVSLPASALLPGLHQEALSAPLQSPPPLLLLFLLVPSLIRGPGPSGALGGQVLRRAPELWKLKSHI